MRPRRRATRSKPSSSSRTCAGRGPMRAFQLPTEYEGEAFGGGASADVQRLIAGRVGKALAAHLSKDQVTQLRVRIVRLGGEVSH